MEFLVERNCIIESCRLLEKLGLVIGTWGNVSMRVGSNMLVTPSRIPYDVMVPEDLVLMDLDGNIISGNRVPTSERQIHRLIYRYRPDVNAVIHAHPSKAMAVSVLDIDEVPCIVEEMSQLLGGGINLTRGYISADKHIELAEEACARLMDRNAVILRNHGIITCGRDMNEAILACRIAEKDCGIFLDAVSTGHRLRVIPKESIKSERYRFLYIYGKE